MGFRRIRGQDAAVGTLTTALRAGRVHHAYRFQGPDGVGKELAAMALAQALVCAAGDPLGCEVCDACLRAVTFSPDPPVVPRHPDLILVERGLYPPDVLGRSRQEISEISVDQVRKIVLQHAAFSPHEGRARVVIVRRAAELSISAANGLLKTLEEPRQGLYFILLTSRPEKLIDTIRSRTQPVRFGPLADELVTDILAARGITGERAEAAVDLAGGSASAALDFADEEASKGRDAFVKGLLDAVEASDLGPAVAASETGERTRDEMRRDLRAVGAAVARASRQAARAGDERRAALLARRYELVAESTTNLDKNASANLTLLALIASMRAVVP